MYTSGGRPWCAHLNAVIGPWVCLIVLWGPFLAVAVEPEKVEREPIPFASVESLAAKIETLAKTPETTPAKTLDALSPYLSEKFEKGTSLFRQSRSRQAGNRALSYGHTGETIVGLGQGNSVEVVHFPENAPLVAYLLSVSQKDRAAPQLQVEGASPRACVRCHGENFTLIWGEYLNPHQREHWPGSLGDNTGSFSAPEVEYSGLSEPAHRQRYDRWYDFHALKSSPRFAPFFKPVPAAFGPFKTDYFPYHELAESTREPELRGVRFTPDFRLAIILTKRAARNAWQKAIDKKSLLKKYHPLLAKVMLDCPLSALEAQTLNRDFARLVEVSHQEWSLESYAEPLKKGDRTIEAETNKLKLWQLLGTAPWEFILAKETNPEARLQVFDQYQFASPLSFNNGESFLENYLFSLVWEPLRAEETGLEVTKSAPPPVSDKPDFETAFMKPIVDLVPPHDLKRKASDPKCDALTPISEERLKETNRQSWLPHSPPVRGL